MVLLSNLKLVASKRNQPISPVIQRRNKLCGKLDEQLQIIEAQKMGQIYAPTKLRNVTNNATGETTTVQVPKRVKEWFWTAENGKLNLSVKYGSKTLSLNKKGANAIEVANKDELVATIKSLKAAVFEGELDEAINEVSKATRAGFGK